MIAEFSDADIISAFAATLTTASFIPQAAQVVRTGETRAISLTMYSMFALGVALWEIYGLMTGQWAIIVANAITLVLASLILVMKVRDVVRSRRAPSVP